MVELHQRIAYNIHRVCLCLPVKVRARENVRTKGINCEVLRAAVVAGKSTILMQSMYHFNELLESDFIWFVSFVCVFCSVPAPAFRAV